MQFRGNLARLDFAATAPEDVRVSDRDADAREVRVDRGFVREDAFLFGAVADSHDVHVVEIRAAFAPVAMRQDFVAADLAAGFDFAPGGHAPVEERIETRDALAGRAWLHMFEESGEAPDDFA